MLKPAAAGGKQKAAPPAPQAVAPAPEVLPDPPIPVRQVQQLGLTQCAGIVDQMSRSTLTSKYDVQSGWDRAAPAQHVFQSVAVLSRPQSKPPDGLAALIAAPTANGSCEGVTLQVFPLAGDCQTAQKLLLARGDTATPILNARIMIDRNGKRLFLLPGFAQTCIAIAVDSVLPAAQPAN